MLTSDKHLLIGLADHTELCLEPRMLNRHGLITGATGTGKTVTLQTFTETCSAMGIPVLLTDIKGDLANMALPASPTGPIAQRIETLNLMAKGFTPRGVPVTFWDVTGQRGNNIRVTVSSVGPLLLSTMMGLNDVQSGVLLIVFRIADDNGLLLLDFKDLQSLIAYVAENRASYRAQYGNISSASIGAIQRALLQLKSDGIADFFGEPMLEINDFMRVDTSGYGMVNIKPVTFQYS